MTSENKQGLPLGWDGVPLDSLKRDSSESQS